MTKSGYRCLVLDHDDTVVSSTPSIHYPAFAETLKKIRPGVSFSLDDFFRLSFDPGFTGMCMDVLGFSDEEMALQTREWESFVKTRIPTAFSGVRRLLKRWKAAGGYIVVSSHSLKENILRDYRENGLPAPDLAFGWELPEGKRKPSPYALDEAMKAFSLSPMEILVVDDLKPGMDMAHCVGADFAAAGWANRVPEIVAYMQERAGHYFSEVEALERFLFDELNEAR